MISNQNFSCPVGKKTVFRRKMLRIVINSCIINKTNSKSRRELKVFVKKTIVRRKILRIVSNICIIIKT